MLKQTAEISEIIGNKIQIKFQRKGMCSGCKTPYLCDTETTETLLVDNPKNILLNKGDKVSVGTSEKKMITAAIILFLLPAVIFLCALILLKSRGEILSFILSFSFLVFYYLLVKIMTGKQKQYCRLKIIDKL